MSDKQSATLKTCQQIADITVETYKKIIESIELVPTAAVIDLEVKLTAIDKHVFSNDSEVSESVIRMTIDLINNATEVIE